jgi:predicted membrane channel-forming protein YqfA (hemolysin III family)
MLWGLGIAIDAVDGYTKITRCVLMENVFNSYLLCAGVSLIVVIANIFLWRMTKRVEGKGLKTIIYLFMAWLIIMVIIAIFGIFIF